MLFSTFLSHVHLRGSLTSWRVGCTDDRASQVTFSRKFPVHSSLFSFKIFPSIAVFTALISFDDRNRWEATSIGSSKLSVISQRKVDQEFQIRNEFQTFH